MEFVRNKERALDFGAGSLKDSNYLLNQGFKEVVAVDSNPAIEHKSTDERIRVVVGTFEDFDFPTD